MSTKSYTDVVFSKNRPISTLVAIAHSLVSRAANDNNETGAESELLSVSDIMARSRPRQKA